MNNWKDLTKLELEELFSSGLWYDEIGEMFLISGKSVRDKCKKLSIILPRKNKRKDRKEYICKVCGKIYYTDNEYCSSNCKILENNLTSIELQKPTTELGKQIVELRKEGKSISQISELLGCSKSTVSYYCSSTTKAKHKEKVKRLLINFPTKCKLIKHIDNFKCRTKGTGKTICLDWNKKIRTAVSRFRRRTNTKGIYKQGMVEESYTYKEAIEHLGGIKTKCYLTGKEINLETDDYCLDHIIPVTKGGSNELNNMGITIPEANASKSDLSLNEYLDLCKTVLENFGYTITK